VVIFALDMIKVFKQRHAIRNVIDMLENDDVEIRATAMKFTGRAINQTGRSGSETPL
jgi:hypothetical protein